MGSSGHEETAAEGGGGAWRVFWACIEGARGSIALALEYLVEQILSWKSVGGGLTSLLGVPNKMDTLHTLLVGWLVFVVLITIIGGFFYFKFVKKLENEKLAKAAKASVKDANEIASDSKAPSGGKSGSAGGKSSRPPVPQKVIEPRRKATIVPDVREPSSPPVTSGSDPDAVNWVNNIFTWLYNSAEGGPLISKKWLEVVGENTAKMALETGVLVEIAEMYPVTPGPALTNMVVDCTPNDNMTITCDCNAVVYLRIGTTRTHGEMTTESEYAVVIRPFRGRLNIAVISDQLLSVVKFDGWPEVQIELEGIRNNDKGLLEQSILEVINEVVQSAVRNSVLELNFQNVSTFPRFRRARQAPDKILPVGYDAMVRELQAHPPRSPKKSPTPPIVLNKNEDLQVAKDSFSGLTFPQTLCQQGVLTTSEEQLIVRNLNKYPSLEHTDMTPEDFNEWQKSWEVNYVPATDVPTDEQISIEMLESVLKEDIKKLPSTPSPPLPPSPQSPPSPLSSSPLPSSQSPLPLSQSPLPPSPSPLPPSPSPPSSPPDETKFVLVASRSKMIDEPRDYLPVIDQIIEDEELEQVREPEVPERKSLPEPDDINKDEPILRTSVISRDSILGTPKLELPKKIEEDKEDEDLEPIQFDDEFGLLDKSKSSTSGFGIPTLPGLQKGPFASTIPASTGESMGIPGLNGKRLLVKIVKAAGIGCDKPVVEAYAIVEMDEPPQKFTTAVTKDTSSPFWDEQFLFDLSDGTLELLFEIYDKADGNFLGLGIVGIEELVATPSQRQIIPLQSRPYEDDEVSGSLTVEFLFLDRADLPELTVRSSSTSQSLSSKGDLVTTTTTTYVKTPESKDVLVNGGDSVPATVLRDIEEKNVPVANNANKSTMIIHASRKPDEGEDYRNVTDDLMVLTTTATTTISSPTITQSTPTSATGNLDKTTTVTSAPSTNVESIEPIEIDERGRSRGGRKRDSFFGTLKKRFSRSKARSKSMDPAAREASLECDDSVGRSVSMERAANLRASGLLSVPPNASGDGGSTRSSISDASAISSSSTRTYINEASTLIIESSENGILKHYLIPLSLQQKSKWRKKGLKLHIFGEHSFIAKHMPSSTPCQVCQKTLGRRFGKQGYECRDCGFKCHKPCHVKTDTICPNSTVNNMDLEYVKDPREERRNKIKKLKST